jgi:hypothetical protein
VPGPKTTFDPHCSITKTSAGALTPSEEAGSSIGQLEASGPVRQRISRRATSVRNSLSTGRFPAALRMGCMAHMGRRASRAAEAGYNRHARHD